MIRQFLPNSIPIEAVQFDGGNSIADLLNFAGNGAVATRWNFGVTVYRGLLRHQLSQGDWLVGYQGGPVSVVKDRAFRRDWVEVTPAPSTETLTLTVVVVVVVDASIRINGVEV